MSNEFNFSVPHVLEDLKLAKNYNNYIANLVIKFCPNKNGLTLDFGAGTGHITKKCIKHIPNINVIELDSNLRKRLRKNGFNTFESIYKISNESIDYIYSLNVLEHIQDDKKCIQEFYSKLKPGGKLFLFLPAFNILYSSLDRKAEHFRRYTKNTLIRKIHDESFVVKHCYYVDSMGFFMGLIFKYYGSKTGDVRRADIVFFDRFIFPISKLFDSFFGQYFGKNIVLIAKKI